MQRLLSNIIIVFSVLILFCIQAHGQNASLAGKWDSNWGDSELTKTLDGYSGTYTDDNGRFVLKRSGSNLTGYWAEDLADEKCEAKFMGTYYWGRLEFVVPTKRENFTIKWAYCKGDDFTRNWNFTVKPIVPIRKLTLPKNGIIEAKGMLRDAPNFSAQDKDLCDCSQITLARVKHKKYKGTKGNIIFGPRRNYYSTSTLYDPDNNISSENTKIISLPPVNYKDQMCFYFTYPEKMAYSVRERSSHTCRVIVEIKYPHTRASGGHFTDSWQLYAIRGLAGFKSSSKNYICRTVSQKGENISSNSGMIQWGVNGRKCAEKALEFK